MTKIIDDTNPKTIKELVSEVHSAKNVLPDFQRQFVWEPKFTAELLNSIRHDYPAGSILRMRYPPEAFGTRKFDNVETNGHNQPDFLILDGQQRLTSLHNAIYGVGKHIFFMNVKKLLDNGRFSDAISWEAKNTKKAKELLCEIKQFEELTIPFATLVSEKLSDWIENLAEKENFEYEKEARERRKQVRDVLQPIQEAIRDYEFPVVCLKQNTSLDAICTIFETINNTGVRLSVFDLLTARFFPRDINLPDRWQKAKEKYQILEEFDINPYYVLQTVSALTYRYKVERSDVLKLNAEAFKNHWDRACKGFADVLSMLQSNCGVISKKWLPYGTILVTLSTVVCEKPIDKGPSVAERCQKLCRFFWLANIGAYYQNSPTTRIEYDIPRLLEYLEKGNDKFKVEIDDIKDDELLQTTPRQRAFYKTIMCALLSKKPKDIYTGKEINSEQLYDRKIEDHHIFPIKFLSANNSDNDINRGMRIPDEYDNIVNRTLIARETNRSIGSKAPSKYLSDIENEQFDESKKEVIWESHLINSDAYEAMKEDNFDEFCDIRVKAIIELLKELLK